jgi:hypothetical protein
VIAGLKLMDVFAYQRKPIDKGIRNQGPLEIVLAR